MVSNSYGLQHCMSCPLSIDTSVYVTAILNLPAEVHLAESMTSSVLLTTVQVSDPAGDQAFTFALSPTVPVVPFEINITSNVE